VLQDSPIYEPQNGDEVVWASKGRVQVRSGKRGRNFHRNLADYMGPARRDRSLKERNQGTVRSSHHRLVADGVALHFVTAGKDRRCLIHAFRNLASMAPGDGSTGGSFNHSSPPTCADRPTPGPLPVTIRQTLAGDVRAIVAHVWRRCPCLVVGHDMVLLRRLCLRGALSKLRRWFDAGGCTAPRHGPY